MHIALGNFPGIFFFVSFNKIQDGRQNPMSLSEAWSVSWICFMFFFTFWNFSAYFCTFWPLSKFDIGLQLKFYILGMLTSPEKFVLRIVFFFRKIQDGRQITCYSQELELLHRFVPRKHLNYPGHMLIRFWCDSASHFYVVRLKISDCTVSLYNWCILGANFMWGGCKIGSHPASYQRIWLVVSIQELNAVAVACSEKNRSNNYRWLSDMTGDF